jgi:hypothetical protein
MDLTTTAMIAAVLSGAVVGLLLAVFGGGGSVLATPALLYVVGLEDTHLAIGTSAAAVAVNAAINLVGHARSGRVKWPCASVFAAAGLAGALGGSSLAKQVDGQQLLVLFAAAMAAIALSMMRKPKDAGDPLVHISWRMTLRLAPIGLATGFAAGFFGIGGGFLIVPGLTLANAAASSLLSVSLFGAATSANYALSGLVVWPVAALFIAGGMAGGWAGLRAAGLLASRALLARRLFAGLVLIVAAYVAWKGIAG